MDNVVSKNRFLRNVPMRAHCELGTKAQVQERRPLAANSIFKSNKLENTRLHYIGPSNLRSLLLLSLQLRNFCLYAAILGLIRPSPPR